MDYTKIWTILRCISHNEKWHKELLENDRNFWRILPAACRIEKVKLTKEEQSEAYHRFMNLIREGIF